MSWRDNGHVLQHSMFCVVRCIHIQLKVIAVCIFSLTTLEHHCYPIHSFNGLSFLTLRDSSIPDESELLVLECFIWSQTTCMAFHVPCCPVLQSVTANIPVAYYLQSVTWIQEAVQSRQGFCCCSWYTVGLLYLEIVMVDSIQKISQVCCKRRFGVGIRCVDTYFGDQYAASRVESHISGIPPCVPGLKECGGCFVCKHTHSIRVWCCLRELTLNNRDN